MHRQPIYLVNKVLRKVWQFLVKPIYKRIYKPLGIIELDNSIYPHQDYRQTVAPDRDSQYDIYTIFDGRIDTDLNTSIAVINKEKKLVSGASWQWEDGVSLEARHNNIFTDRDIYRHATKCDRTVFSLISGGAGEYNYFHWLFDCLSRLHLLRLSGLFDRVDLFLVPSLQYSFQRETLLYLGIDPQQVIESTGYPNIQAPEIIVTEHPVETNIDPLPAWICDFLRSSFLKHAVLPPIDCQRIYINRKDAINSRQIVNEDKLITELKKLGFISISATNYSFCEQIGIFANTEVIVSAHGAGLANLVFCQEGTKVVEIFNHEFQPKMYEQLSEKRGAIYRKVVSGGISNKDPLHSKIIVDVEEVIEILDSLHVKPLLVAA